MKICNTCGFECADDALICPTCGKNCDGSDSKKDIPLTPDPFEEYRKQIDRQIKEQEIRINAIREQIKTEITEEKKEENTEKNEWDKTEMFSDEEVKEYRLAAVLIYLTGIVGIILSLLINKESEYLKFHIKEGIKITVLSSLLIVISLLLCWTFIVPILSVICEILIIIISFVSAVWTIQGKSKNAFLIRNLTILN